MLGSKKQTRLLATHIIGDLDGDVKPARQHARSLFSLP